jgi:hypothetical protein
VNLLFVKVYYAQLKKETVTQRQTFNLFVLLGSSVARLGDEFIDRILAEIGGSVGLYLGATVVTVLEVAVFFIEGKVRRKVIIKKRTSETSVGVSDVQVRPPLNKNIECSD